MFCWVTFVSSSACTVSAQQYAAWFPNGFVHLAAGVSDCRGLSWSTTAEKLEAYFSNFGQVHYRAIDSLGSVGAIRLRCQHSCNLAHCFRSDAHSSSAIFCCEIGSVCLTLHRAAGNCFLGRS